MTYTLPSPTGAVVWTTPTMEKVLREATPPANQGASIVLFLRLRPRRLRHRRPLQPSPPPDVDMTADCNP
jgi:hypothetical protein